MEKRFFQASPSSSWIGSIGKPTVSFRPRCSVSKKIEEQDGKKPILEFLTNFFQVRPPRAGLNRGLSKTLQCTRSGNGCWELDYQMPLKGLCSRAAFPIRYPSKRDRSEGKLLYVLNTVQLHKSPSESLFKLQDTVYFRTPLSGVIIFSGTVHS